MGHCMGEPLAVPGDVLRADGVHVLPDVQGRGYITATFPDGFVCKHEYVQVLASAVQLRPAPATPASVWDLTDPSFWQFPEDLQLTRAHFQPAGPPPGIATVRTHPAANTSEPAAGGGEPAHRTDHTGCG